MKKLSILIFCLLAVVCFSCSDTQTKQQTPPEYKTTVLDTTTAVVYSQYATTIQSRSFVEIRPKVTGYLTGFEVEEGKLVKKGDVLFHIDDSDFKQRVNAARAAMYSAKAAVDNARLEVKKLTPLVEKGIISQLALDTQQSNLEAAIANYDQATANYENAKIELGYTVITAPMDGVLGRIYVRDGSLVSMSNPDPLTTIASDGDVYAYFSFDEKSLANFRKNHMDNKKSSAMKDSIVELILPNGEMYQYKGILTSASGSIDRTTGSIQLKVIFPNPDMQILSGSSGVLRFPSRYQGCIVVPQSATFEIQDKVLVYVVDSLNTVHGKSIAVEGVSGNDYVVSSGIEKGDRIVIEGVSKLKEGMAITPKD